ncbi:Hsp70 family protein [Solwaraspora sp. WMMD1047]|uniref:Hsp70 family protein n=1 Tax=Solwaraspora sp. WMMD1047 TaxID=3016102 RepID=UPI0024174187|nr:Hsp70 family protein [Solwaraspora sp. WMMD1047]MDG4829930.1 Hsp70 family protein [Solwaraspora sp. WMMD1047]
MDGSVRLGVDFGTAHTVAVLALPGREPRPLLFDGSPLLPSAVCGDPTGRLLAGRDAVHTGVGAPASFEPYPKRCIDDGTVLLGGTEFAVADLIGAVLHRVAAEAVRVAGATPSEVVLSCPASWAASRRGTLLAAASSALPGARLVAEPVAAASYFVEVAGSRVPAGSTAVVYDFGAGTFDASVVRCGDDGFEVLAEHGLADCGGLDIDAALVGHLGGVLAARDAGLWGRLADPESAADRRARRLLWENVRAAKEMLSRTTTTIVHVPLFDTEELVGREELERLAGPILDRTVEATRSALASAEVAPGQVAAIFLTGGSSRIPAVATLLHRGLGIAPTVVDQPELAVAEGSVRMAPRPRPDGGPAVRPDRPAGDGGAAADGAAPPTEPGAGWPAGPAAAGSPAGAAAEPAGSALPSARLVSVLRSVRRPRVAAVTVLGLAVVSLLAVVNWPRTDQIEPTGGAAATPSVAPSGPSPAASSPAPASGIDPVTGLDRCLVGTWRTTSLQETHEVDSRKVRFTGAVDRILVFRSNNTYKEDFSSGGPTRATASGAKWEIRQAGVAKARYRTGSDGVLLLSKPSVTGTSTWYRNGRRHSSDPLGLDLTPSRFVCFGDSLTIANENWSHELVRVPMAPAPSG